MQIKVIMFNRKSFFAVLLRNLTPSFCDEHGGVTYEENSLKLLHWGLWAFNGVLNFILILSKFKKNTVENSVTKPSDIGKKNL